MDTETGGRRIVPPMTRTSLGMNDSAKPTVLVRLQHREEAEVVRLFSHHGWSIVCERQGFSKSLLDCRPTLCITDVPEEIAALGTLLPESCLLFCVLPVSTSPEETMDTLNANADWIEPRERMIRGLRTLCQFDDTDSAL
jgi:hypothetical protein